MEVSKFKRKKIGTAFPASVEAKWSRVILNEGFVPFPKRMLRSLHAVFGGEHAVQDLAVVLAVADYRRPNLIRLPSIGYLAWNAGLTTEEFLGRLRDLEERGLVKRSGPDEEVEIDLSGLEARVEQFTPDEDVEEKHEDEN